VIVPVLVNVPIVTLLKMPIKTPEIVVVLVNVPIVPKRALDMPNGLPEIVPIPLLVNVLIVPKFSIPCDALPEIVRLLINEPIVPVMLFLTPTVAPSIVPVLLLVNVPMVPLLLTPASESLEMVPLLVNVPISPVLVISSPFPAVLWIRLLLVNESMLPVTSYPFTEGQALLKTPSIPSTNTVIDTRGFKKPKAAPVAHDLFFGCMANNSLD